MNTTDDTTPDTIKHIALEKAVEYFSTREGSTTPNAITDMAAHFEVWMRQANKTAEFPPISPPEPGG